MAILEIGDGDVVVRMSWFERLEAFHGEVRVPRASVREVRAVETAWPELRGIRAPGTGLPGVVAVGTRRGGFGKDFVVVHGRGPAVVVDLEGAQYARLVVTVEDAGRVAAALTGTARA